MVPLHSGIFSLQGSHRSSSDRLFLTAIDCYMGGCQLKGQWNAFYASLVPLECQRCVVSADPALGIFII